jgi:hypothetical protein
MQERTHARLDAFQREAPLAIKPRAAEAAGHGVSPEDAAFVSAILNSAAN